MNTTDDSALIAAWQADVWAWDDIWIESNKFPRFTYLNKTRRAQLSAVLVDAFRDLDGEPVDLEDLIDVMIGRGTYWLAVEDGERGYLGGLMSLTSGLRPEIAHPLGNWRDRNTQWVLYELAHPRG